MVSWCGDEISSAAFSSTNAWSRLLRASRNQEGAPVLRRGTATVPFHRNGFGGLAVVSSRARKAARRLCSRSEVWSSSSCAISSAAWWARATIMEWASARRQVRSRTPSMRPLSRLRIGAAAQANGSMQSAKCSRPKT